MDNLQEYFVSVIEDGIHKNLFVVAPIEMSIYEIRNRILRSSNNNLRILRIDTESRKPILIDKNPFDVKSRGRTHEECDDCKFEETDPPICDGHCSGECHCKYFLNKKHRV